jgi:hypothetical protein
VAGMENDLLTNGTTNALGQLYYELAGNASSSSAALQSGGGVAGKAGGARAVGLTGPRDRASTSSSKSQSVIKSMELQALQIKCTETFYAMLRQK